MQHLILSIILCLSVSNTEVVTKYSTSDLSGFDNISNHQENTMLIFGTVRNGTMPVAGADVHLVLNYADASHPYDDSNHAMTNADGEYFFETSVFDGYSNFNLTLNPWQNNSTTYFPALVMVPVPSTPQEFNFNSQPINPEITINSPNQSSLNLNINDSINLEALVALSFEDGSTTLSSVEFKMNNVVISNTNNQDIYSGTWTPSTTDYGLMHTFTVKAESSNNEMSTETFDFMLNCMGVGCPNILPQVMLVTPANTTINQSSGFQNIPIAVTATDSRSSHYGNSDTVGELLAQDNNYDWATSNLSRLADMNIFSILWGGGSTVGTASIGTNGAGDDGWLAGKVNDYYDNVVFSTTADPAYQISCCFADAECKDITVQLDENNEITISAEDVYDGDTKCSGTALSVSPSSFNSTHIGPNTVTLTLTDDTNRETTCTAVVTVEPTLGIDDPELLLSAIVLYPNPADDVIHISNPKQVELQKVSIYDLNGRLLKTLKFNSVSTESIIDISTLTLAPYVVLIETPQGTVVKYLIKK